MNWPAFPQPEVAVLQDKYSITIPFTIEYVNTPNLSRAVDKLSSAGEIPSATAPSDRPQRSPVPASRECLHRKGSGRPVLLALFGDPQAVLWLAFSKLYRPF